MGSEYNLGFLGGGQLARMSIQAAQRMGLRCLSLDPGTNTPASQIAPSIVGSLEDPAAIARVLEVCEHVTLENEFIPAAAIRDAFEIAGVSESRLTPSVSTLATIQDKFLQRKALASAGVDSPTVVEIEGDGRRAIESLGFPLVLKARFGGYDGKGIRYAHDEREFQSFRALWQEGGWMAESFVPFIRELATMVWIERETGVAGGFATMETVQENHVCDLVYPGGVNSAEIAIAAVRAVGGYGLFGVEMFELQDGSVQINEIAPRPHNTGHFSLDWGAPSQFDVHIRLAMGLPVANLLARTEPYDVCMANLLGQPQAGNFESAMRATLTAHPGARFHWYGKAEAKPGRKMGHINVVREQEPLSELIGRAKSARRTFYDAWTKSDR